MSDNDATELVQSSRKVLRVVGLVVVMMFVLVIAMEIQLQRRNQQLDRIESAITEVHEVTELARSSVESGSDPEAQARTAQAVSTIFAVQERVNEILLLLCEQSPDSQVCQGG